MSINIMKTLEGYRKLHESRGGVYASWTADTPESMEVQKTRLATRKLYLGTMQLSGR